MSDKVDFYMPWFFGDYLKDTLDLTLEEHGAYMLLLGHMWNRGGTLPGDHDRLARLLGTDRPTLDRLWVGIGRFFGDSGGGLLMQKRLLAELDKAKARKTAAVENGRKGGQTRSQRMQEARAQGTHTEEQWQALVSEFEGRCVRCAKSGVPVERDHIVPVYQGGSDAIENIQPLCARCNSSKGRETTNWAEVRRRSGWATSQPVAGLQAKNSSPSPSGSPSGSGSPEFLTGASAPRPLAVIRRQRDKRVGEIFGWFRKHWQARYRGQWVPEAGVASNVSAMLSGLDELPNAAAEISRLPLAIERFFQDDRRHLLEAKHPLRLFCQDLNKYRLEAAPVAAAGSGYARL